MLKRSIAALFLLAALALPAAKAQHESAPAAGETHPAAADRGEEHGTKPQLLPDPTASDTWWQAAWVMIIFVVLLVILYPTAWKNVLAGLKAREERIRKDIADAEATRKKAEATLREYNTQLATAEAKVRDMLTKAGVDAEKIATSVRMQAQQDAEDIKERTTRDLEAARKQAVAEFRQYAATVATNAAEQILRRNLNENDQRDLVDRSLDQLESV